MRCFTEQGVQVEAWFKGELLFALNSCREKHAVQCFDREVKALEGRKGIDLKVMSNGLHWVEIKHWLIGMQRSNKWAPSNYFADRTGVVNDVDKLLRIEGSATRWLLILNTANPGPVAWQAGLDDFNRKFVPRRLLSLTDPADFPLSYCLGLLQVNEASSAMTAI